MTHESMGQLGSYAALDQPQLRSVELLHVSVIIWWPTVG